MSIVVGTTAFEPRPDSLSAETREDAASRLRVPGVNGSDLEPAANDANQPAGDVHVEVSANRESEWLNWVVKHSTMFGWNYST